MGHKGYYGQYTGNAKWSKNHADTKVTKSNYKASERDDAAHIDYLKRDINYDNKHSHSDENMTADEKHISKLAGDMKYDKEHHDSPAKKAASAGRSGHPSHMQPGAENAGKASGDEYWRVHQQTRHHQSAPTKMNGSPAKNKVEGMSHEELAKFSQDRPMPASGKTGYERHMETHGSPAKGKAVYVGGTVDYQSGDTTREFGTSGGNRRSVEIKSNIYGNSQATKTVHKLNKKTNEVESKTRNISNKRASRIEDRKYKRFRKAKAQGVNDILSTERG